MESLLRSQEEAAGSEDFADLDKKEMGLISLENSAPGGNFPESDQQAQVVEDMLADEISKLSLVEHEKIMFEVHGIEHTDQEDPEDVDSLLQQVEEALGKIRNKKAYEAAKYLDEKFVTDRSFRLMFLRCDRFDINHASQRIVRHFEVKQALFGDEALARDIRLSDFSKEDMLTLESGCLQLLPSRDVAGRPIFSIAPMYRPESGSADNLARAMWYILTTTMKDAESQRKGVVSIMSNFGVHARKEPLAMIAQLHRMKSGLPKKFAGVHYCFDDAALKPFVTGIRLFLSKEMRTRFRPHFGTTEEISFELQTFGIPTNEHPLLQNGELGLEWHRQWLDVRRIQEESDSSKDGSIIPRRFDVLFGRGKNNREHTGNLRAAHLVEMHQEEYEKADKSEKTEIALRIVSMIHESFGRFLKWEKEGWVEVDEEAAREKISHFFRHLRSRASESTGQTPTDATIVDQASGSKRITPCTSPIPSAGDTSGKSAKLEGEHEH